MAAKTFSDITAFVTSIYVAEGGKENLTLYATLFDEALVELAERTQCYERSWSTAVVLDGLAFTGNVAPWPDDLIAVKGDREAVMHGTNPLIQRSLGELDGEYPNWRTMNGSANRWAGDGNYLYVNGTPSSTVTIRGYAYLPKYSVVPEDPNPLALLQDRRQMAPAHYILSRLPADPENPMAMARKADYAQKWEAGIATTAAITNRRKRRQMSW